MANDLSLGYFPYPTVKMKMQEPKGSETDTQRWEEGGLNVVSINK